jgi:hypothetical protein
MEEIRSKVMNKGTTILYLPIEHTKSITVIPIHPMTENVLPCRHPILNKLPRDKEGAQDFHTLPKDRVTITTSSLMRVA